MNIRVLLALLLPCTFVLPVAARAQWTPGGVLICNATGAQNNQAVMPIGVGGAMVVWTDHRNGVDYDIYAQRFDGSGTPQWGTNGVVLCAAPGNQLNPALMSDGRGGVIVAWDDFRSGDPHAYVQRILTSGDVQWATDGIPVCTAGSGEHRARLVPTGSGDALVVWDDGRNGNDSDVYAQSIDIAGTIQWAAEGVPLCTATGDQFTGDVVAHNTNGAIVTWYDIRGGNDFDVYAQWIDHTGAVRWTTDGVALCTAASDQDTPAAVSDGAGGAIVAWEDYRSGSNYTVYAQRVDASGDVQWIGNGVAVAMTGHEQTFPTVASDGTGGAFIAWTDIGNGTHYNVYAQRLNASGVTQWSPNGVALTTNDHASDPAITSDDGGDAIVAWNDNRGSTSYDVYAQLIDASGTTKWTADGVGLVTAAGQQSFVAVAPDGSGGAFVTWEDFGNDTAGDLDILRVGPNGLVPTGVHDTPSASTIALSANYPNPFSAATTIDLTLRDAEPVRVEVFDVAGRRVREIEVGRLQAGESRLVFDGMDDAAHALPSGVYFYRVHAGREAVTRKMVIDR